MYGIFNYMWLNFIVNVGKISMHGSYGYTKIRFRYHSLEKGSLMELLHPTSLLGPPRQSRACEGKSFDWFMGLLGRTYLLIYQLTWSQLHFWKTYMVNTKVSTTTRQAVNETSLSWSNQIMFRRFLYYPGCQPPFQKGGLFLMMIRIHLYLKPFWTFCQEDLTVCDVTFCKHLQQLLPLAVEIGKQRRQNSGRDSLKAHYLDILDLSESCL